MRACIKILVGVLLSELFIEVTGKGVCIITGVDYWTNMYLVFTHDVEMILTSKKALWVLTVHHYLTINKRNEMIFQEFLAMYTCSIAFKWSLLLHVHCEPS